MIPIYEYGTIVKVKETGQFAQITRVCWCQGHWAPLHYEAWVFEKGQKGNATLSFIYQRDTQLESLPYEPSEAELKESLNTLAEIIVNLLLKDLKSN